MRHPARPIQPRVLGAVALALVAFASLGCNSDRLKRALGNPDPNLDPRWRADSAVLSSDPQLIFRAFGTKNGTEIAPIGTISSNGFRGIRLADRGWRAFDLQYLRAGQTLQQYRDGHSIGAVTLKRGMWGENAPALDSIPGCPAMVPSALATVSEGVHLLTTSPRPPIPPGKAISDSELQEVLQRTDKLIAPTKGIPVGALPKYTRTVRIVNNGAGGKPTVVVMYDDPEVLPDSTIPEGQRPRHLVVFLDFAVFGYKTTWTYVTLGNKVTQPRLQWLDYMDVNNDGSPEVLFGVRVETDPLYTIIVKYAPPFWIEETRQTRRRCQG